MLRAARGHRPLGDVRTADESERNRNRRPCKCGSTFRRVRTGVRTRRTQLSGPRRRLRALVGGRVVPPRQWPLPNSSASRRRAEPQEPQPRQRAALTHASFGASVLSVGNRGSILGRKPANKPLSAGSVDLLFGHRRFDHCPFLQSAGKSRWGDGVSSQGPGATVIDERRSEARLRADPCPHRGTSVGRNAWFKPFPASWLPIPFRGRTPPWLSFWGTLVGVPLGGDGGLFLTEAGATQSSTSRAWKRDLRGDPCPLRGSVRGAARNGCCSRHSRPR
jgi:hypothetical protein